MAGDAIFDRFVTLNPDMNEEDLAGVAGDSMSSCYADLVAERAAARLALVLRALQSLKVIQRGVRRHLLLLTPRLAESHPLSLA